MNLCTIKRKLEANEKDILVQMTLLDNANSDLKSEMLKKTMVMTYHFFYDCIACESKNCLRKNFYHCNFFIGFGQVRLNHIMLG